MITDREIELLKGLTRYHVLSRPQIQRLYYRTDNSGRATRRRLQLLCDANLINRQNMLYTSIEGGAPAAVYFPSAKGCEFLACRLEDERYLATNTNAPIHHHIPHWLAISETHIALDAAVEGRTDETVAGWINEYDVVNPEESAPEKRYRLYTLLKDSPRLICAPDAAFLFSVRGHSKVFYLEQDRNTTAVKAVADGKARGYAMMAELGLHRRHFPEATDDGFRVILVTTHPKRRDLLRGAMARKPGASLWRFTLDEDLLRPNLLYEKIFYPCEGEPNSLLKPPCPEPIQ